MKPEPIADCIICAKPFMRMNTLQTVCSVKCARKVPIVNRKAEREKDRATRERLKPRSKWLREAQAIANKYARVRDYKLGCVSCDKPASWNGQWHGSHFRSVGAASSVRLNLWNIHKACSICNHFKSGNVAEYRPRLIKKIGLGKVEWLESNNKIITYEIEYLIRYKAVIGKRLKRMERSLWP